MSNEVMRYRAAVAAMQGFFSVCSQSGMFSSYKEVSEEAVKYADALLAELDRTAVVKESLTTKPDADGWIPHRPGDPMPCDGDAKIIVKLQDGAAVTHWYNAHYYDWGKHNGGDNIVAWKPA